MAEKKPKSKHHHGDLRNALIDAGVAILAEDGLDGLTLRKCAARAGVSHAAPSHHFDGVAGLRAAITEEGFRIFRNYMLDARNRAGDNPHERLKAICRGYLFFAVENPALFELIFGIKAMQHQRDLMPESPDAAYLVLRETCAPFVPEGADPLVTEAQVWSLIHGFCTLYVAEQFGKMDAGALDLGPFDQVMGLLDTLPLAKQP